jgi:hypothetical protein
MARQWLTVQRASLELLDPDPDQVARNVMALRKTVERLAGQELLGDQTLEIDATPGAHPNRGSRLQTEMTR